MWRICFKSNDCHHKIHLNFSYLCNFKRYDNSPLVFKTVTIGFCSQVVTNLYQKKDCNRSIGWFAEYTCISSHMLQGSVLIFSVSLLLSGGINVDIHGLLSCITKIRFLFLWLLFRRHGPQSITARSIYWAKAVLMSILMGFVTLYVTVSVENVLERYKVLF